MGVEKAVEIVNSPETSVSAKTRALFHLRCLDTEEAALALQKCITGTSVLIDHEVAYILGQMKQPATVPFLFGLAEDTRISPIVRHEAIEALGNFGDIRLIERIEPFLSCTVPIVKESAILAIRKLQGQDRREFSKYHSRDPAHPYEGSFEEAKRLFRHGGLEEKYRAMFYLRDLNSVEAVEVLAGGFEDPSDLLRHEVAYVFGQMRNEAAVGALVRVVENEKEAEIVRHEAAEALGNIGGEEAEACLGRLVDSKIRILNESAQVGLGIYENGEDEYTNIE